MSVCKSLFSLRKLLSGICSIINIRFPGAMSILSSPYSSNFCQKYLINLKKKKNLTNFSDFTISCPVDMPFSTYIVSSSKPFTIFSPLQTWQFLVTCFPFPPHLGQLIFYLSKKDCIYYIL
jgi:hypothetical protein